MKKAEIKITVTDDNVNYEISRDGVNNHEIVGMLDYLKHAINQRDFLNNVKKGVIQHKEKSKTD